MDLEQKLTVAKEELEKTALDKVSNWGGASQCVKDITPHRCEGALI